MSEELQSQSSRYQQLKQRKEALEKKLNEKYEQLHQICQTVSNSTLRNFLEFSLNIISIFRRLHWSATTWISSPRTRVQPHHHKRPCVRSTALVLSYRSIQLTTSTMTRSIAFCSSDKCSSRSRRHRSESPTTHYNRNPSDVLTSRHMRHPSRRSHCSTRTSTWCRDGSRDRFRKTTSTCIGARIDL